MWEILAEFEGNFTKHEIDNFVKSSQKHENENFRDWGGLRGEKPRRAIVAEWTLKRQWGSRWDENVVKKIADPVFFSINSN